VVIHATATNEIDSPKNWLCDPDSKVSAHYLIGKTGVAFHLVHESDTAWHAGVSSWGGQENVNDFGVGIELVNDNTGSDPYPEDQLKACAELVKCICSDYSINPENVIGHLDIAPGRKTDPAGFPWDDFRSRLGG
jgi:N-acetylmuramoyl-L-alanine amidase